MSQNGYEHKNINIICPHCKVTFTRPIEFKKSDGLYSTLINNHPNNRDCPPFLIFIDAHGKHRGSQKIDVIEQANKINEKFVESTRNKINELEDAVRFYHIKVPSNKGGGFECQVTEDKDRAVLNTKFYHILIEMLIDTCEENMLGIITLEKSKDFEGGVLTYGKYQGMIFTIFWKDQKAFQRQSMEDIQMNANLTVEKLFNLYDLADFLF
ncbi:MAG: hypothetical protein ACFFAS_20510 [Promethearchaeota archaeon]